MSDKVEDLTYTWILHKYYGDQKVFLDGRLEGNMLRFVNDYGNNQNNCFAEIIPYRNRWALLYITNRLIEPGEEISINYGDIYWNDRKMLNK